MPDGCPAALSFLFLKWTGLENKMERLTGWEKDREIALRLLSQANKLNSGKINWITFQLELDGEQQGLHQLPSVPLFPRLNITPSFPNPLPLPNWNKGGNRALWSICNSSPLQLLLHHHLPPQYSVVCFFFFHWPPSFMINLLQYWLPMGSSPFRKYPPTVMWGRQWAAARISAPPSFSLQFHEHITVLLHLTTYTHC